MEIEQSSLFREIELITKTKALEVHYAWHAEIHVNKMTYRPLKVLSIDFQGDYENNYADVVMLSLSVLGGTYAKRIYPFKDDMEITLYRIPLYETGDLNNAEVNIQTERYRATLIDTGNPIIEGNGGNMMTEESLNLTNIFTINFQLVDKAVEQLRMISVGGTYRRLTVENAIKAIMTTESQRVKVEGIRLPKGVDMVPSLNKTIQEHISLPQGIPLTDVPAYIHEMCGGVYSAGFGYYLKDDFWYVYPCYDNTRFKSATDTLTIINVPPNKLPGAERTYRKDGKNLVILATGEVRYRDNREVQQLNAGNGTRFANANNFMDGSFSKTKNNKTAVSRGANNSEFISVPRKTGLNNVRLSNNNITANPFLERSKLAARQGTVIALVWENSLPSLFYPGMPVHLMYLVEGEIKELYGTLSKTHSYVQTKGVGLTDVRYTCRTVLTVFVSPPEE